MLKTLANLHIPKGLPELPYGYDALEPYIDSKTMELHHDKHHRTYVEELEKVLQKYPQHQSKDVAELLQSLDQLNIEAADREKIRNHGGGHANHSFFWTIMGPDKSAGKGDGKAEDRNSAQALREEVSARFESIDNFKKQFSEKALGRFGSGWSWLVRDDKGELQIYSTANQDSPLMQGHLPLIGLDLWEHAYYLKYQNRRKDYIENWWKVLKVL